MQYQTQKKKNRYIIFQINIFNYILYILFLNFENYEVSMSECQSSTIFESWRIMICCR